LLDSSIIVEDKFILIGRNDVHDYNRKPLDSLIPANINLPVFVMDHRALSLGKVSDYAVDLQVSGHTHNGQLFPFQWITRSMYELSWGHKKVGDTHFIVSAGAQGWGPQVRTTAYSEIVVIDVYFN